MPSLTSRAPGQAAKPQQSALCGLGLKFCKRVDKLRITTRRNTAACSTASSLSHRSMPAKQCGYDENTKCIAPRPGAMVSTRHSPLYTACMTAVSMACAAAGAKRSLGRTPA
jgi:hypothetical protein